MTADAIDAGRKAWARISKRTRHDFDDWICIARACAIGRAASLQIAETNKPFGKRYMAAMASWLQTNGLDGLQSQERYWALAMLDHVDAIKQWRDALPDAERRRLNHPQAIWVNWNRSLASDRPTSRHGNGQRINNPRRTAMGSPQNEIRAVASAMRDSGSRDWLVLAAIACRTVRQFLEPPAGSQHSAAA